MSELLEIIDRKFTEGLDLYLNGNDSFRYSKGGFNLTYEVVALDSDRGPNSRCLISRDSLESKGLSTEDDIDIVVWCAEIPRTEGDTRRFEALPVEAIVGNLLAVGTKEGQIAIKQYSEDVNPSWLTVQGLAFALSDMRVAESIPL